MGVEYRFFCDYCKRSTPVTSIAAYPEGWVKILHTDHREFCVCSYQCLADQTRALYEVPPPTMTSRDPVENPTPPGHHAIPDTAGELIENDHHEVVR